MDATQGGGRRVEEILVFVERFAMLVENKRMKKKGRKGGCVACDGRRGEE